MNEYEPNCDLELTGSWAAPDGDVVLDLESSSGACLMHRVSLAYEQLRGIAEMSEVNHAHMAKAAELAQKDLKRLQAHERGEHDGHCDPRCF